MKEARTHENFVTNLCFFYGVLTGVICVLIHVNGSVQGHEKDIFVIGCAATVFAFLL